MKNIPQDRSSEDRVMSHLKAEYGFSAMRPDELVGSQELFDCLQMLREAQQNIAVAEYRQTKKYPKIRDATERFKQKIMKVIKPVSYNYGDQAISHTAQKEQYFQQFLEDYNNINNHDQILEKFRLEYPNTQVDESLSHQVQIAWYYAMKAHGDDMLQMHISLKGVDKFQTFESVPNSMRAGVDVASLAKGIDARRYNLSIRLPDGSDLPNLHQLSPLGQLSLLTHEGAHFMSYRHMTLLDGLKMAVMYALPSKQNIANYEYATDMRAIELGNGIELHKYIDQVQESSIDERYRRFRPYSYMTQEELLLSILFHGDKYSDFHKQKILADLEQVYERQQTRKDAQED